VLVAADPQLRDTLSGLSNRRLIRRCADLKIDTPQDTTSAAAYTLRLLARRILTLTDEIRKLEHQITTAVTHHTPHLLTRCGIGPDNAAALLIAAGDNPDRLRSEASFATLCGLSPLEASSGKTTRHRLNRGGDRQANTALYRIALCRLRWDTRTRDYLARRITEGKTRREAIRCLKRYIAREIYRIITSPPDTQSSGAWSGGPGESHPRAPPDPGVTSGRPPTRSLLIRAFSDGPPPNRACTVKRTRLSSVMVSVVYVAVLGFHRSECFHGRCGRRLGFCGAWWPCAGPIRAFRLAPWCADL
jgi:Transposase IS116/IS110/IS902 family